MGDSPSIPCPVCGDSKPEEFFTISRAPIVCHLRYTTAEDAVGTPTGRISLARCTTCGLIYNCAFETAKLEYDVAYDNALHHSAHFRAYAEGLAQDLAKRHGLAGKNVVEIGCGDGFFLSLLCTEADCHGWGFDPTVYPRIDASKQVQLIQGYFGPDSMEVPVHLVCCRHVLEHLPSPRKLLQDIRDASKPGETVVYFEVPDGRFTFDRGGYWDILYEHCSYYTPATLRSLFEREGFDVVRTQSAYDGQFLQIEARVGKTSSRSELIAEDNSESLRSFNNDFESTLRRWREELAELVKRNGCAAIWGAGTKGVMFLNALDSCGAISCAVDINPDKQGTYLAGTTVPVVAPDWLAQNTPEVVILMNSAYADEVQNQLAAFGLEHRLQLV